MPYADKSKQHAWTNAWKKRNRPKVNETHKKWLEARPGYRAEELQDRHLRKTYGITKKQRDDLLQAQGGCCAICGLTERPTRGWHTDHCHVSGAIRGVLCNHCNWLLGHAHDNPDILSAAIEYLGAHAPTTH